MKRRLRIGISSRIQHGDPAKTGLLKRNVYYLEQSFLRWVQSAGVIAYAVPEALAGGLTLADYVAELDGLILQGGADISPAHYGEEPLKPEWSGDPIRDRYELELLNRFIDAGKPVLGICRGHQLINVALGGSLHQDIVTQVEGAHAHVDPTRYDEHFHHIDIAPGSGLASLYPGIAQAKVNTLHHQSINRLAPGLSVEAISREDGVIEAVRGHGPHYLVGVQWHPEFIDPDDPELLPGRPLLDEFLAAAKHDQPGH
jgi:putative glutamine amidotransferase